MKLNSDEKEELEEYYFWKNALIERVRNEDSIEYLHELCKFMSILYSNEDDLKELKKEIFKDIHNYYRKNYLPVIYEYMDNITASKEEEIEELKDAIIKRVRIVDSMKYLYTLSEIMKISSSEEKEIKELKKEIIKRVQSKKNSIKYLYTLLEEMDNIDYIKKEGVYEEEDEDI